MLWIIIIIMWQPFSYMMKSLTSLLILRPGGNTFPPDPEDTRVINAVWKGYNSNNVCYIHITAYHCIFSCNLWKVVFKIEINENILEVYTQGQLKVLSTQAVTQGDIKAEGTIMLPCHVFRIFQN